VLGAEMMAHQGFDWLALELGRGPIDKPRTASLLRAIGTTDTLPLVRVSWNDLKTIAQALEAGAAGIFVPSLETRDEVERFLTAARSLRPDSAVTSGPSPLVVVTLETALGLKNVREITEATGIDACFVATAELSTAIGLERCQEPSDERYFAAISQIYDACQANGVAAGLQVRTRERAIRHLSEGWQLVGIGSDSELMASAAASAVAAIRDHPACPPRGNSCSDAAGGRPSPMTRTPGRPSCGGET
jgi:4-hydroxy-2-oxoheptanedioate aldolase